MWIIPLKKPLENGKFRPRLLERFLHEIYGGKCFYWDKNNPSKIYSVHFELAYRHFYREAFFSKEKKEFFEELSYKKPYATIKNAVIDKFIEITEDFNMRIPEKPFVILKTCPDKNWKFNKKDCFVFDKKILLYDIKNIRTYNKQDEMIVDYNTYRLKELETRIITSGKKYRNCRIKDILADRSYCLWLYNEYRKQGFIKGFNMVELEDIISACKIKFSNF